MHRFLEEEARKQANIEAITAGALPLLEETATPEQLDDDWITNFFDKSRIISDGEMQRLWSRILAGEANTPGTFAKRTVNLLADLEREDAKLFAELCGFGWHIDDLEPLVSNVQPIVFDLADKMYQGRGLTFASLSHLDTLGLVQFDNGAGFCRTELSGTVVVSYHGQPLTLTFPSDSDNELDIGKVLLTRAGHELASVCGAREVEGFFEYVKQQWIAESLLQKNETELGAPTNPSAAEL